MNINPLTLSESLSAILTTKIWSSSLIVPWGNSTDSSLTSVGIDNIPIDPTIIAATIIGMRT